MNIDRVGNAIAYLRKRAGYTQKDLANRLGISDKAVSKWERGLGLPDISLLGKLSILLDTDTDSLLAGDVIHHDKGWGGLLLLDDNPVGVDTYIYDKPIVYFLLSYFLLVGIKKVLISCTEREREYLIREFGDGRSLGMQLFYYDGKEPLNCGGDVKDCKNYMVVFGRIFLYGVDQTRFFQRAMVNRKNLTVLSLPRKQSPSSRIYFDAEKKIVPDHDISRIATQYDYSVIPVLFCPKEKLPQIIQRTEKSLILRPKLSDRDMVIYTEVLDRGFVEITINTWEDVNNAANFLKIVQETCGMNVYCIEEIAWRRGMISSAELESLGHRKENEPYGKYILSLCAEN